MDSNYTPLIDSKDSRTGQTSSHSDINVDLDDDPADLHVSLRDMPGLGSGPGTGRSRRGTVDAQPTRGFRRTQHHTGTGSSFSIQSSGPGHLYQPSVSPHQGNANANSNANAPEPTPSVDLSSISHLLKPKAAPATSGNISGSASSPSSPKQKSRTGTLERPSSAQQQQQQQQQQDSGERHRRRDSIILAPHFHEHDASGDNNDDGPATSSSPLGGFGGLDMIGLQRATTAPQSQVASLFGPRPVPVSTSPSSTSLEYLVSEFKAGNVKLTPLPSTLGIVIVLNVGGTPYHTTPETLSRAEPPSLLAWIAVHAVQTTKDGTATFQSPSRALSDIKTPTTPASIAAQNINYTLAALSLGTPASVTPPPTAALSPRAAGPGSGSSSSSGPVTRTYTIDRNPRHFNYVLDYLRDKRIVLPKDDPTLREIGLEARFYQLQGLFDAVQSALRDVISNQHLTPDDVFWRDCVLTLDRTFQDRGDDGLPELGRNTFINMLRRLAFQQDPMLRVVHATYKGTREYRERCLEILRTNCTVCDRTVYYRPIGLREGRETGCPCHPPTGTWDRTKQLWTCCGSPQFQGSGCKQTGIHYTTWTFLGKP